MKFNRFCCLCLLLIPPCVSGQSRSFQTYMNPVIPGDHPDCTISKIGKDFYTTGSSFNVTPILYHSTDLVHWEAIAQPVSASWADFGDAPGGGCWGGHFVLYHGKYWDFFARAGLMYFVTADKPEGPWSLPVKIDCPSRVPGWGSDNSIFIDSDSAWYLVVKNMPANNWIVQLGLDGQPSGTILNLTWLNPAPDYPYSWAEGPVIWKYKGYYYYSFARDLGGPQYVMRSPILTDNRSSWESPVVFFNQHDSLKATSHFTEPNHNSNSISLDDSTHWVLHPLYAKDEWKGQGRQGLLNQVHYDSVGQPTADYPIDKYFTAPRLPSSGIPWMVPKSDFFLSDKINPEWSFLGYTTTDEFSVTDRPGWLRLSPKAHTINTVTKNDGEHNYSLMTRLDFDAKSVHDEAGLIILRGDEKSSLRLYSSVNATGKKVLCFRFDTSRYETANIVGDTVWLKMVRMNHSVRGYFSGNGHDWKQVGQSFTLSTIDAYSDYTSFTGTRQGLYVQNRSAYFDFYIYRDAYTPILAECPTNQYGTAVSPKQKGISSLDNIRNNNWALFAGVEFGNSNYPKRPDSLTLTASCASAGGVVEVWLDSLDSGVKIAECPIRNTGSWTTYATFSTKVLSPVSGRHDVYLKFVGSEIARLFMLQWILFKDTSNRETTTSFDE